MRSKKINKHKFFTKRKQTQAIKIQQSESFQSIAESTSVVNDQTTDWSFQKISLYASPAWFQRQRLIFGVPPISQILYPGQTFRLSTGWKVNNIPAQMAMHVFPSQRLLSYGLISFPKVINANDQGFQITQILYNDTSYPIIFSIKLDEPQKGNVCIFKQQQIVQFSLRQLFHSFLTTVQAVVPLFL